MAKSVVAAKFRMPLGLVAAGACVILGLSSGGWGQATPTSPAQKESSLTLAQIVARQEENYRRIRNAEGQVVWKEERFTSVPASSAPPVRVVFFAFEGERSVEMILPWNESYAFPRQDKVDWSSVLAASFVDGDVVHVISTPAKSATPQVRRVPYNPAVHENNPLVSFHPRLLGDERVRLGDLVAVVAQMHSRPTLASFVQGGRTLLRLEFVNAATPGEKVYYVLDPAKAFLAEEIGRVSQGRYVFRTQIVNGQTKDGTWIPARRQRVEYDASGRPVRQESWYYNVLSVNEGLARRQLSLLYFHLPAGADVQSGISTNAPPATRGTVSPSVPGGRGVATPSARRR